MSGLYIFSKNIDTIDEAEEEEEIDEFELSGVKKYDMIERIEVTQHIRIKVLFWKNVLDISGFSEVMEDML